MLQGAGWALPRPLLYLHEVFFLNKKRRPAYSTDMRSANISLSVKSADVISRKLLVQKSLLKPIFCFSALAVNNRLIDFEIREAELVVLLKIYNVC